MLKVPMVDAVWAKQVHDMLARAGRPAADILRQAGIERARIESPAGRIAFSRHAALLEVAAEELADDLFGMRFGLTRDLRDAGLIAYVALNSATFAEAVRNLDRYLRVFTEGFQFRGSVDGDTVVLTGMPLDDCVYSRPQIQGFAVATMLAASRSITHRELVPMRVEVYHGPPSDPAVAERLLGASIHYACPRLAIVAPRSWLDLPIEHADSRLLRVLEGYCREILAQRGDIDDLHVKLERWLVRRLPSGRFVTAEAARELGMSPRTLARRLRERAAQASPPSPTTCVAGWRSAISTTRTSGCRRSPTCSATRSRARSITPSAAGPGGRRRRIAEPNRHPIAARREGPSALRRRGGATSPLVEPAGRREGGRSRPK
jgi:hypothetical protein